MRDPGAPRRNPLFAVDGDGDRADASADAPEDVGTAGAAGAAGAAGPIELAGALLGSLGDASPEAMEHLLLAGKEVIAAARVLLDAAERAIDEAGASSSSSSSSPSASTTSSRSEASPDASTRRPPGRVRKIDLA